MKRYNFTYNFEKVDGFYFLEPVERINGKKYFEYEPDSFERKNWHKFYWADHRRRTVFALLNCDSSFWVEEYKLTTLKRLYKRYKQRGKEDCSSWTNLFDFEIALICRGYKTDFGALNATQGGRTYKKEDRIIKVEYGLTLGIKWAVCLQHMDKFQIYHMPSGENINKFIELHNL